MEQINAATSAKQAQLRAIQAGLVNKNKSKPVSTVEPFQRSISATQQVVDNHHVSAEDLKPPTLNQDMDNMSTESKYQTLPYNTKFGLNNAKAAKIEQLKQEKENNNVGFSEALPRPPPQMYGGRSTDYQGNYGQGIGVVAPLPQTDNAISSMGVQVTKPISSVAPVFTNANRTFPTSTIAPPTTSASTSLTGDKAESPPKLRPALPPKPVMPGGGGQQEAGGPVHGDEGTSVDDEDLPPPPPTTGITVYNLKICNFKALPLVFNTIFPLFPIP